MGSLNILRSIVGREIESRYLSLSVVCTYFIRAGGINFGNLTEVPEPFVIGSTGARVGIVYFTEKAFRTKYRTDIPTFTMYLYMSYDMRRYILFVYGTPCTIKQRKINIK